MLDRVRGGCDRGGHAPATDVYETDDRESEACIVMSVLVLRPGHAPPARSLGMVPTCMGMGGLVAHGNARMSMGTGIGTRMGVSLVRSCCYLHSHSPPPLSRCGSCARRQQMATPQPP